MIIVRTPFRISFLGGGTDYPSWYKEHGGEVLATTIDKYCYINMRYLPPFFEHNYRLVYSHIENVSHYDEFDHPAAKAVLQWAEWNKGLEIHHDGDLPARSGLGSSSSFTVSLLHALYALRGQRVSKETLAKQAIHVEQEVIKENVGSQDQISAAFGGFNHIEFKKHSGEFQVNPVILPGSRMHELQSHLMLFFTGFSRIASEIAKSKIDNFSKRETELKKMSSMVAEAMELLHNVNMPIDGFGQLLHESWMYKKSLSDKISTPDIDDIYDSAIKAGATGGKILGAGGGGFILIFAKPEFQEAVRKNLSHLIHVPFQFENSGSRVVLYQPNGLT